MDDLGLISTSRVNDPSCCLHLWVDGPDWVDDLVFEGEILFEDGSGRANLKPFLLLLPPRKEVLDALGGIIIFL